MDRKPQKIDVGKDSVVIGQVTGTVGDGSVVIGATDERGNTIINQPMAVGRGAQAGPGSIAIGAGASAGVVSLAVLANRLSDLVTAMNKDEDSATHQDSIVHVAQAAEAAKKNDGPTVLHHLKAAGQWAFDFASGVGASVVAAVIWKAIGM